MPAAKTRTQSPKKTTKAAPKSKRKPAARDDSSDEESETEYNSDALDDDSEHESKKTTNKRKRGAEREKKARSSRKKTKKTAADDEYDVEEEIELEDGQEIVGVVVQAPKTGLVPKGCVSQNTFDFLSQLKDPKCNDREWFKLHDPVFRQAEKEWQGFIEVFTDLLVEADDQIPPLPPKDVIHRIYRDIRFSNDKTPYKTNFSASFSRSGRKGIFAFFKPGDQSIIAAGSWCPGKNELSTIRSNILRSSTRLRQIISNPVFVGHFGEPKPGDRRNIFGREDELKVAPKGIAKDHPDIDLLKCRSFCVVKTFTDAEVLSTDFKDTLAEMVGVLRPLVHCLNDMMTIPPDEDENEDEE